MAAACSARQRGKHICGRNQREGWLTTRVCQSTNPAHKHGDYASARERRVTAARNNAIKPFWGFITVPPKQKEREGLCRVLSRRRQLEGRNPCWGLVHLKETSSGRQVAFFSPSPLTAPEHSSCSELQTSVRAARKLSSHFSATPWQRHRSKAPATSLAGRGFPDSPHLVSSKWM